jgi:hypothetical protein
VVLATDGEVTVMKNYATLTKYGYRIPLDDGEGGVFMYVRELISCRGITFSRAHIGNKTLYEYSDEHGTGRYYFTENEQLRCFDQFVEMAVFEITGNFWKDFQEELALVVVEINLNKITP